MGELFLVRHGQANSGATTEEDYDRLSPLGHKQAALLGDWMRAHNHSFDQILCGTMRRHRETAAGMGVKPDAFDARLNEMRYFALADDMLARHGVALPQDPGSFAGHLPPTLAAWEQASINGAEPFADFDARIHAALSEAAKPGKRVLCVSSAGVISMVMRRALSLSTDQMAHILLPIHNSSLHRFSIRDDGTYLSMFNATPHLDHPDLADHRTQH